MGFNLLSEDRANKTGRKLFSMKLPVFSMGKEIQIIFLIVDYIWNYNDKLPS